MCNLVNKYNVAGPRYTSYPTVPYWNLDTFSLEQWKTSLRKSFKESNETEGISIYIHLPFCESLCTFCGCNKRITKRHASDLFSLNQFGGWSLELQGLYLFGALSLFFLGAGKYAASSTSIWD